MNEIFNIIDSKIDSMKDLMIEKIREIVKFPSVEGAQEGNAPFGKNVDDSLNFFLALGEEFGFKTKNVDHYAGHIQFGDKGDLYGVLGHLDVVPEGSGWNTDPYTVIEKDGYLYGRGTQDDKGPTVASIIALKALKDSGFTPNKRLRIIAGTNEETGWAGINYYFQKEETPVEALTPDAGFPMIFAEKGIISFDFEYEIENKEDEAFTLKIIKGGEAANSVASNTTLEIMTDKIENLKNIADEFKPKNNASMEYKIHENTFIISFQGKSAHASTPDDGINSISASLDFLSNVNFNDEVQKTLKLLNEKIGYETDGKSLGIKGKDEVTGDLTCNLGLLNFDGKKFKVTINIRYPIFFSKEMISSQIREAISPMSVKEHGFLHPLYVSPDSDFIKMLRKVYEEVTGLDSTPFSMGGGTYARAVPKGVAFGAMFPYEEPVAHQPNERMAIDSLMKMAKIYARVYYEWLK